MRDRNQRQKTGREVGGLWRRVGAGWLGALLVIACGETPPEPAPKREPVERAAAPAEEKPPNLILITMDTTRADALGTYGQALPTTPTLDRLAREGVTFEHTTTSNPETLPSHSTIMTGKFPYSHGVRANAGFVLSDSNVTLAEHLDNEGYSTSSEIAANVLGPETLIAQGFENRRDPKSPDVTLTGGEDRTEEGTDKRRTRPGSDISAKGIRFIRQHRDDAFFLWLHYFDPHNPYQAPALYNKKIPDSPYHAEVLYADAQIKSVIDEIERLGLRERTLVVITADHGEGLDEHGEPTHSYFVYDTVMRVPLIFWGLDLPEGRRIKSLVRTADLAPTALELMGRPALEDIQGVSLEPLISGAKTDLGLPAYGEATRFNATFGLPNLRFIRDGRWKYIHKVNPELYDIAADPSELTNLASERPDVVERLRGKLESVLAMAPLAPEDARAEIDAATADELAALGYVTRAPELATDGEGESLELYGDDVSLRTADVVAMARVHNLLEQEKFQMVVEELTPVSERNPESVYVLGRLAEALVGLERTEDAIALLERVLALDPVDTDSRHRLATQLVLVGKPDEALPILSDLVVEIPCNETIRMAQTKILHEKERYGDLIASLGAGHTECPDLAASTNNYAWALSTLPPAEHRDGKKALRLIKPIVDASDEPDPAYLDTLAAALAETGDFANAEKIMQRVIKRLRALGAPPELISELEARRNAYLQGQAWREAKPHA